ncbi:MAG: endonuclease/exonuclease/phosphatase family protein [Neomegalonema sp.]|nr:endonuclease/exonuclease/phosphatase family protein [Neomegalonema sp.]
MPPAPENERAAAPASSSALTIATYNIEWFTELFSRDNILLRDDHASRRYKISREEQADAIAAVLRAIDPDVLLILEAPNDSDEHRDDTVAALERFARYYRLRQRKALLGFPSPTHQEIALLYDPDRIEAVHEPMANPAFDTAYPLALHDEGLPEIAVFSKPPLEARITDRLSGAVFRLIGVHLKSKNPRGGNTLEETLQNAVSNRRKQAGQALWLRQTIDAHLAAGDDLLVLGDFNDGPGFDPLESILGRSALDEIAGQGASGLINPYLQREGSAATASTARFWRNDLRQYLEALLDFVLLSPELAARTDPEWRIWHPFNDPEIARDETLQQALLTASDHFPSAVRLTFSAGS